MKISERIIGMVLMMMVGVILPACVADDNASKTKAVDSSGEGGAAAQVAADKAALAVGFVAGDSADWVTQNLTLATTGVNGSTIVWESDMPTAIDASGSVVRTGRSGILTVRLTATISLGAASDSKIFTVKLAGASQAVLFNTGDQTNGNTAAGVSCDAANTAGGFNFANVREFIADISRDLEVPSGLAVLGPTGVKIADSPGDLFDGTIDVSLHEAGVLPLDAYWWSGATANGQADPGLNCNDWTSNLGGGAVGSSMSVNSHWVNINGDYCGLANYRLCIGW